MSNYLVLRNDWNDEGVLEHHGIMGMKWGVRRYQNPDGSLTEAGRRHYGVKEATKAAVATGAGVATVAATANAASKLKTAYDTAKRLQGSGKTFAALNPNTVKPLFNKPITFENATIKPIEIKPIDVKPITTTWDNTNIQTFPSGSFKPSQNTYTGLASMVAAKNLGSVIGPALATPIGQVALVGAAAAGTGLAIYGIYKGVKLAQAIRAEKELEKNK